MRFAYNNLRMQDKELKSEKTNVGAMGKRRETMADEKRYIIYYTFKKAEETSEKSIENEVKKNV